jgi:hypothetical protein
MDGATIFIIVEEKTKDQTLFSLSSARQIKPEEKLWNMKNMPSEIAIFVQGLSHGEWKRKLAPTTPASRDLGSSRSQILGTQAQVRRRSGPCPS